MVKPDYQHSIVNLMSSLTSSLALGLGAVSPDAVQPPHNPYSPLKSLAQDEIASAQHVVLLLVDGLGYNYVQTHGTVLKPLIRDRLTSVFPSTTAAAITSLLTARAPQQHAVTGWFMNLKELGTVAALLPFKARWGGMSSFSDVGADISDFIMADSVFNQVSRSSYFVIDEDLLDTPYSVVNAGRAKRYGYAYCEPREFSLCLEAVRRIIHQAEDRTFTYAYWPMFDSMSHEYGVNHPKTYRHFQQIERGLNRLFDQLQGTDTLFIVVSDHGIIDSSPTAESTVYLHDHPQLSRYLSLPLCGEPRAAYCYVRNDSIDAFTHYIERHLSDYFDCYPSQQFIAENWFGLGEPSPVLAERVGDYILLSKGESVIVERLPTEASWTLIGVHGGTHPDEMYVPLMTVHCG